MMSALEKFLLSASQKVKKLDEMPLSTVLGALGAKAGTGAAAAGKAIARDPKLAAGSALAGAGAGYYMGQQPDEEEIPLEDEELLRRMYGRGL